MVPRMANLAGPSAKFQIHWKPPPQEWPDSRRNLCGRVKTLKIHPIDILSSQYNHSIHLLGDSLALSKSGGKAHLIKSANRYEVCIEGWCMECMSVCYLVLFAIDLVTLNNVPFIILKLPSIALVESPAWGVVNSYSLNASLATNIVSLAPESIKVGIFPFPKFWKPWLISAIGASLVLVSIKIPDLPGVSGAHTVSTKCSGCLGVMVALVDVMATVTHWL